MISGNAELYISQNERLVTTIRKTANDAKREKEKNDLLTALKRVLTPKSPICKSSLLTSVLYSLA